MSHKGIIALCHVALLCVPPICQYAIEFDLFEHNMKACSCPEIVMKLISDIVIKFGS